MFLEAKRAIEEGSFGKDIRFSSPCFLRERRSKSHQRVKIAYALVFRHPKRSRKKPGAPSHGVRRESAESREKNGQVGHPLQRSQFANSL